MKSPAIALIAPFPNPHFLDVFQTDTFRKFAVADRYCFRSLPPHRRGLGWEEDNFHRLSSNYLKVTESFRKIEEYDIVIYYGAIDPKFIPALLIKKSLSRGQRTLLVTEGIRHAVPAWKAFCCKTLLNHPKLEIFAIGDQSADDFRKAGLVLPDYFKFGFFENYSQSLERDVVEKQGPVRLLSVGQLIERKNFSACLESLQRISSEIDCEIIYTICGDGPQMQLLKTLASRLPKHVAVDLLGNCNRDQLNDCFNDADVFLMPSKYDGWGVVLNQALHYCLPLITSSGVRSARGYLLKEGGNGFIFNDDSELDKSLKRLIIDNDLRKQFASQSQQIARHWHIDTVGENLVDFFSNQTFRQSNCDLPLSKL